jgi:hypothetical protein
MEIGITDEQTAKREDFPSLVASDGDECQPSQALRTRKKNNGQTDHASRVGLEAAARHGGDPRMIPVENTYISRYKLNTYYCHTEHRGDVVTDKDDMLLSFCRQYEIDILLLQEVIHEGFAACSGYTAHVNIGTDRRGTAILMRQPLSLERIDVLPSGRGIAGYYTETYIVNVYAPLGAARRAERQEFCHVHLPYLFRSMPRHFILGGDFNCVLSKSDCTGEPNIRTGEVCDRVWRKGLVE